jgi:hypothetical protein
MVFNMIWAFVLLVVIADVCYWSRHLDDVDNAWRRGYEHGLRDLRGRND